MKQEKTTLVRKNAAYRSNRVVCLNSATAVEALNLRILELQFDDEVIIPVYTYTASVSAEIHCSAKVVFVDIRKDGDWITHMPEMDYEALEKAIMPKNKVIITVVLGGLVCNYAKVFENVEKKRNLFISVESDGSPLDDLSFRIQKAIGRIAVVADCTHLHPA